VGCSNINLPVWKNHLGPDRSVDTWHQYQTIIDTIYNPLFPQ